MFELVRLVETPESVDIANNGRTGIIGTYEHIRKIATHRNNGIKAGNRFWAPAYIGKSAPSKRTIAQQFARAS
jgi:hypothetical protein